MPLPRSHLLQLPTRIVLRKQRVRIVAATVLAACALAANRPPCIDCTATDVRLRSPDGTRLHARLYIPEGPPGRLPAVIVCHGYLANRAFMEIPWAADITRLGAAALFLDRRGHGSSNGTFRPSRVEQTLWDLEPDIAAALAHLRLREMRIDSERIGILGHSDGATAAITAASADWSIRTTVAASASVAPWQYVNHVAPRDMLLVYGAEDRFVLGGTESSLIWQATRGSLEGPGVIGAPGDGAARKLIIIGDRGHVDVISAPDARREILAWLKASLGLEGEISISPLRRAPVAVGLIALLALLVSGKGGEGRVRQGKVGESDGGSARAGDATARGWQDGRRGAIVVALWILGLFLGKPIAEMSLPLAQQGSVYLAFLLGPSAALAVVGGAVALIRGAAPRGMGRRWAIRGGWSAGRGAAAAIGFVVCLQILLVHQYEMALDAPRLLLFAVFAAVALPAFAILEGWIGWAFAGRLGPSALLLMLGSITAVFAVLSFERLAVAPGMLLGVVLILSAVTRIPDPHRHRGAQAVAFSAIVLARIASVTCPLY